MPYRVVGKPRKNEHYEWRCNTCGKYNCQEEGHDVVGCVVKGAPTRTNHWSDAMKRPDAPKESRGMKGLANDPKFSQGFPFVYEFLTETKWEDGGAREVGTLTLFIESGVWKACLNDRDSECSMYVTGETTLACMKALEARLDGSQQPDWRQWKKKGKR